MTYAYSFLITHSHNYILCIKVQNNFFYFERTSSKISLFKTLFYSNNGYQTEAKKI